MPIPLVASIFLPVLQWIFRKFVIYFVISASVFVLIKWFAPYAIMFLRDWILPNRLVNAFSQITPEVWWFADAFQFGYGIPLLISAYVTRFLIRRLPFIG